MVYFLVRDPLVAVAMDHAVTAAASSSSPALADLRATFIHDAVETALGVMTPSVALDSLWVLLHLRRQFVLAQAAAEKDDHADDDGQKESVAAKPARTSARFSDWVLPCCDTQGYLDHLLLHERGVPTVSTAASSDGVNGGESQEPAAAVTAEATAREAFSAVAVLDLALDALAPSPSGTAKPPAAARRSPSALLHASTLGLLIRDVEMLWCWKYLMLQVHKRNLAKRALLTGEGDAGPQPKTSKKKLLPGRPVAAATARETAAGKAANGLPLEHFFHDYALLVPADVMASFAATAGKDDDDDSALRRVRLWLAAIATEASSAAVHENRQQHMASSQSSRGTTTTATSSTGAMLLSDDGVASLILVPAVSPDNNPDRRLKNRRVDVIEGAAMNYFYKQLASRGGGRGGGNDDALAPGSSGAPQRIVVGNSDVLDEAQLSQNDILYGRRRPGDAEVAQSFASFLRSASIGFDIHIMSLTGAGVGYYVGHVRGRSTETCILYAVIGLVVMMFVDATLLIIRLGRHDEGVAKQKAKSAKARAKLSVAQKQNVDAGRRMETQLAEAAARGARDAVVTEDATVTASADGKLKTE